MRMQITCCSALSASRVRGVARVRGQHTSRLPHSAASPPPLGPSRRGLCAAAAGGSSSGGSSGSSGSSSGGSSGSGGRYVPGPDDMAPSIAAAASAGAASAGGGAVRARAAAVDLGLDPLAVSAPVYSPAERLTLDESPVEAFFARPRLGAAARHTDEQWVQQLAGLYRRVLLPLVDSGTGSSSSSSTISGGSRTRAPVPVVVDLCSAALSHLPQELLALREGGRLQLVGHGVNEEELAANPAFSAGSSGSSSSGSSGSASSSSSSWTFTADLNASPRLPLLQSGSVAAVLCANGIQYLTRPEWVLAEVARVLAPGGAVVVAFSDACWRERAAAGWLGRSGPQRLELVQRLFLSAGLTPQEAIAVAPPQSAAPGSQQQLQQQHPDAFYAVVGVKPLVPTPSVAVAAAADSGSAGAGSSGARQQQQRQQQAAAAVAGAAGALTSDLDPAAVAARYPGPALREMDLLPALNSPALNGASNSLHPPDVAGTGPGKGNTASGSGGSGSSSGGGGGGGVSEAVLERWAEAYRQLVEDAVELGVPRSAIPQLPPGPVSPEQLRAARDHLQDMIASFLSAGL